MSHGHRFEIYPIERFARLNAAISRPREIACFSYDEDHKYHPDASSLRYYCPPILPADLNRGFGTFRQLDDSADDHLDGLLEAIIGWEQRNTKQLTTDIITWRGMMTKIMTVPYSKLDSWEMNATFYQGTIFIEENHEKKLASRQQQYSAPAARGAMSQDLMSFWGYKFETLSLLNKTWDETPREVIEHREDEIVSNYAQYCSIVRTKFGTTKVVIGGEVDAVMGQKPTDPTQSINWVELKTSAELRNDQDHVKFERKLLKFWAQSFLLGVPKIIVGFRTQQGMLQRLEDFDVQTIPDKVTQQGRAMWDGQTCINFTASFLEWLKSTITTDGVWRVRKRERNPVIEAFKVEDSGSGDILSRSFLDWRATGLPETLKHSSPTSVSQDSAANTGNIEVAQPP